MTEHTPGPWVQFVDRGKCVAIMPAGREGDICTFSQSPSNADARLMTLAPALLDAAQTLVDEIATRGTHERWKRLANLVHNLVSTPGESNG